MTPKHQSSPFHQSGFTLTELLVVLVVLGLIAAAITPQIMGRLDKSKVRAARLQMDTLSASIEVFKLDTGRYPSTDEGLSVLIAQPDNLASWDGPYVRSTSSIIDPWNRAYAYRLIEGSRRFEIKSFGADGTEGGEKLDQDLIFPDYTTSGFPQG